MSVSVLSPPPADRAPRLLAPLAVAVGLLTLLFSTQQIVRTGSAARPHLSTIVAFNLLDWVAWAAVVPLIVRIGTRYRLDGKTRRTARVAAWIVLGFVSCVIQGTIAGMVLRWWSPDAPGIGMRNAGSLPLGAYLRTWLAATSAFNMLVFGMIAGVFHAALYYRDLRRREMREADLEARLARAELGVLRTQLQPHFLFNALHTVSSLMVSDVPAAHRVVTALGDLLRSSLDHSARQEIPLREELTFTRQYLEIQKARFRERLAVQLDVGDEVLDALVPSLVLQPLVENAVRHGIEPTARGGSIQIGAARCGDRLKLIVRDSGVADEPATSRTAESSGASTGIGLTNTAARLEQLYPANHRFSAGREPNGDFLVTLDLPLQLLGATRGGVA